MVKTPLWAFNAASVRDVTPVQAADICLAMVTGLESSTNPAPLFNAAIAAVLKAWNIDPQATDDTTPRGRPTPARVDLPRPR